ncbi:hypothetical protein EDB83DRAFT_784289 [Lactarius deliciosus]|nr:hypothetical protein EDB83DRAFT_784289 [Lactarius deliciosus]
MFQAHYIRNQMASMLHALSSTFTTCACGSKAKDCAFNVMAEFVDGRLPVAASPPSQWANDPSGTDPRSHRVDLGPLVGAQRGFHTRESRLSMARTASRWFLINPLGPTTSMRQLMSPSTCRRTITSYRITSMVVFPRSKLPLLLPQRPRPLPLPQ